MTARIVLLAALLSSLGFAQSLEEGFHRPPDSAKPHTWWHWMNGMVTREGITADLTAMKEVGLGGAQMFHVTDGVPAGPVGYMTPQWRELVQHTVAEADRLGLELCIHNCAGWSSSGGPWIDPPHSMQILTWNEQELVGPGRLPAALPRPSCRQDYYKDIAVLAFPTPPAERVSMRAANPQITVSANPEDAAKACDGDPSTILRLGRPTSRRPQFVSLAFAEPFTAQSCSLLPAFGRSGYSGELQVSDDGGTFRALRSFRISSDGVTQCRVALRFPPTTSRYWRLAITGPDPKGGPITVAELELSGGVRIENWPAKAGYLRAGLGGPTTATPDSCIPVDQVLDLTQHLAADGTLDWQAPVGSWTILRIGHTTTGKTNHPAPPEGCGLECDKLSREAAQQHWDGMMAKVLADVGPLAGKVLNNVLVDSYEVGCQNWTPAFRAEFQKRHGYDLLPYLPAMLGRVVGDADTSERFLWDVRKTIAELFAENYFGFFRDMAHQNGMLFSVEGYGNGNFDNLVASGLADIPMTEFWAGHGASPGGGHMAGAAAHIWGRTYVGAESFTTDSDTGAWRQHPYSLKAQGDYMYCAGVNRFIFHRYAQQPWTDRVPGMTMGPHGFHFDRTNTWWKQAPAWTTYLARCQYLLQSGLFVADFCYFAGEDSPGGSLDGGALRPSLPDGFRQDNCAADALLTRVAVKDGRLVLPDGMSYRLLVLPESKTMTPPVLRQVRDLLIAGATVIGPKPERSPSLGDQGAGDQEVQQLAAEIWGDCDGKAVTARRVGQGTLYWNHPMDQILTACGLSADAVFTSPTNDAHVEWIHRRTADTDWYFVSNQNAKSERIEGRFRVTGRMAELWHPDTGKVEPAPLQHHDGDHTVVSLLFQPQESVFVVFRAPAPTNPAVAATHDGQSLLQPVVSRATALEIRQATYGLLEATGADGMVDVTELLRRQIRDNRLEIVASNALAGDPANQVVKRMVVEYELAGKPLRASVSENQTLRLPPEGQEGPLVIRRAVYGDIPDGPLQVPVNTNTVDVTAALRQRIRDGRLVIRVGNEIAGDPAPNIRKQLCVEYTVDGMPGELTLGENALLELPLSQAPAWQPGELAMADGQLRLVAWDKGDFQVRFADGTSRQLTAAAPPAEVALPGPWTLRFPPELGAPAEASLPKLISWTNHPDEGVQHFSGTATYELAFTVPADACQPGTKAMLDLGQVQVIAEPILNGTPLGILWKPPFRMDVTDCLKPGTNTLQVRVTNLWPNRLIGDEAKPDYRAWGGAALKSWPPDALNSTPPPDTGRITWTTWKHYHAGDPLLPSGLLGPVRLRFARILTVAAP